MLSLPSQKKSFYHLTDEQYAKLVITDKQQLPKFYQKIADSTNVIEESMYLYPNVIEESIFPFSHVQQIRSASTFCLCIYFNYFT